MMLTKNTLGRTAAAAAFLGSMAWMVGCGGAPPPVASMTDTKAAVRGAQEVGAKEVPSAALHLKMANDGIALAEKLVAKEEHERAGRVLARAKLDAELAILMTKTEQTKQEAQQALQRLEKLKSEQ